MKEFCSVAASLGLAVGLVASTPVAAQRYHGGGIHRGVGGIRAGGHYFRPGGAGVGYRGVYARHNGYPGYGWGGGYPAYGYGGYYNGGDWWTPFAIGAIAVPLVAAVAQSDYAVSPLGGYCATQIRTCQLYSAAPIGTGCSCRVPGGRARGVVN